MRNFRLPRRSFLKGLGVSILLPSLDIMGRPGRASATPATSPRFVAFFPSLGMWGHGYDGTKNDASRYYELGPDDARLGIGAWHPAKAGALTASMPAHLVPFASLRQKMMIVSGLSTLPDDVDGSDVNHSLATTAWLTSAWRTSAQATATTANTPPDSIDQFIANAMGFTPGSTIVFNPSSLDGTEAQGGHAGYISSNSRLGGNHLVPKVGDPMKVFNQLFGKCMQSEPAAAAGQADDKSILDYVQGSVTSLQKKLGKDDKARVDSYLQNIRDVEKNLTAAAPSLCPSTPTYDPALSGGPLDWLATLRMMVDVTALALASDAMPIATIMTDTEANGDSAYSPRVAYASDFVGLGGQKITYHSNAIDTHFDVVHAATDGNVQAIEEWFAYTRVAMNLAARLALKLDSMPAEPNGNTPLDNSLMLIGTCHGHSMDHKTHSLPTILLGGKNIGMHQGQYIAAPWNTDLGDFYYTILQAMQISGATFNGRSTYLSGYFG